MESVEIVKEFKKRTYDKHITFSCKYKDVLFEIISDIEEIGIRGVTYLSFYDAETRENVTERSYKVDKRALLNKLHGGLIEKRMKQIDSRMELNEFLEVFESEIIETSGFEKAVEFDCDYLALCTSEFVRPYVFMSILEHESEFRFCGDYAEDALDSILYINIPLHRYAHLLSDTLNSDLDEMEIKSFSKTEFINVVKKLIK